MENPNAKSQLRKKILALRQKLSSEDQFKHSEIITQKLLHLPQLQKAKHLALYSAIQGEVLTSDLITTLLNQQKKLYLPRISSPDNQLEFAALENYHELQIGKFGILEPPVSIPSVNSNCLELALIPGVAFDLKGNRLGWGQGYYDRFLQNFHGIKIALAYDFQVVEALPVLPHDEAMDIILTQSRKILRS